MLQLRLVGLELVPTEVSAARLMPPRRSARRSSIADISRVSSRPSVTDQSNSSTVGLTPWPQGHSPRPSGLRHAINGHLDESIVDAGAEGEEETLISNMRRWRNDAMSQHLYSTASFWGGKAFTMTSEHLLPYSWHSKG